MNDIPSERIVLAELKDFQRKTVQYVFRRLFHRSDPARRFLIADEVGLGKTLVAKGIIAKAIHQLKETNKRIDIVYVCSNQAIAKQNINRISIIDLEESEIPRRLTLLPLHLKNLNKRHINFVSFTPGTSFDLRSSGGIGKERALLYSMLRKLWRFGDAAGPKNLFQCTMSAENWRKLIKKYLTNPVDRQIQKSFSNKLKTMGVKRQFTQLINQFPRQRKYGNIPNALQVARYQLIGKLRTALAEVCINALEPDIVVLDEFQRFRNLLDVDDEMGRLARMIFNFPKVKVILLSATPYKMYTMHHELEREDHYADFIRTVKFLFNSEKKVERFKHDLESFRNAILSPTFNDQDEVSKLKRRIESQLKKVMVRTERLSATAELSGMAVDSSLLSAELGPQDLISFSLLDKVARHFEVGDTVEYWKSAPYLLNVMDREGYQLKKRLVGNTRKKAEADLMKIFEGQDSTLLSWDRVHKFWPIEPANSKLRTLIRNKVENGAWKLLWIPPSLPYYRVIKPPYGDSSLQLFTKSLIFSSWLVAPKAIAMLTSYEAERRMVTAFGVDPDYQKESSRTRLLQFTRSSEHLSGMNAFSLVYPCLTLAAKIDPLMIGTDLSNDGNIPEADELFERVCSQVTDIVEPIVRNYRNLPGRVDKRWYWTALAAMDRQYYPKPTGDWLNTGNSKLSWLSMVRGGDETTKGFQEHVNEFKDAFRINFDLGRVPADLDRVLAKAALASPAVTALRAFLRHIRRHRLLASGEWLLSSAAKVAMGFRSLFNLPESTALVRSLKSGKEERYWVNVLDYCVDGNLQAVMDEYVHVLKEYLGLSSTEPEKAVPEIAKEINSAVSLRTVNLDFDEIIPDKALNTLRLDRHSLRCRFALRFGDRQTDEEKSEVRKDQVRCAFNSPFRPFVLATTSIGQEGLDFHQYCHEIYHWNLPTNPVDLEQREGRIHRYKGHVIRRNLAKVFGLVDLKGAAQERIDPWEMLFQYALSNRAEGLNDLIPYWVFEPKNGLKINRFIPALPLSRDLEMLRNLQSSLAAYRMVMGQPRQEDLVNFLQQQLKEDHVSEYLERFRIDLSPH